MSETRFTPGPWGWFGSPSTNFYLATNHSGRQYVMAFDRMGMRSAQPVFQPVKGEGMRKASELCIFEVCRDATSAKDPRVYRRDVVGFRAPDAHLIAAAPCLYKELVKAKAELEAYEQAATGESYNSPSLNVALAKARGET